MRRSVELRWPVTVTGEEVLAASAAAQSAYVCRGGHNPDAAHDHFIDQLVLGRFDPHRGPLKLFAAATVRTALTTERRRAARSTPLDECRAMLDDPRRLPPPPQVRVEERLDILKALARLDLGLQIEWLQQAAAVGARLATPAGGLSHVPVGDPELAEPGDKRRKPQRNQPKKAVSKRRPPKMTGIDAARIYSADSRVATLWLAAVHAWLEYCIEIAGCPTARRTELHDHYAHVDDAAATGAELMELDDIQRAELCAYIKRVGNYDELRGHIAKVRRRRPRVSGDLARIVSALNS